MYLIHIGYIHVFDTHMTQTCLKYSHTHTVRPQYMHVFDTHRIHIGYYTGSRKKERMSFPPFILPHLTVYNRALTTAVQSVVDPCNNAVYLHSKNPYLHSISQVYTAVLNWTNCVINYVLLTQCCNQLLTRVISLYICTLKTHICTRYLTCRVINMYLILR